VPVNSLQSQLKRFPLLVAAKRKFIPDATTLDVLQTFPLFVPCSRGSYRSNAQLTIQSINQTLPALSSLAASLGGRKLAVSDIRDCATTAAEREAAVQLKPYCDREGSDKANSHDYHHLYGAILSRREEITGVFEVGLGTNNLDVVSNMGSAGRPGASLRAFRAFLPHARIYGADVDRRILFEEERIKTFHVDQTDPESFAELGRQLPAELDLVIDDGLHSPNANLHTLAFGLGRIKAGGWMVIEDIGPKALPVWEVVAALLPGNLQPRLFQAEGALVFAVRRLS
jgi:hypothetical protein